MRDSLGGRASLAAGLLGLSVVTGPVGATAACHSSCRQQLIECKRTCAGSAKARRDCRAACAKRSTCTAPGARIRTLAYVVNDCTTDPQGRSSLKQKLLIRRGNCDPVPVVEFGPSTPVPNSSGLCRNLGVFRHGTVFVSDPAYEGDSSHTSIGVFQAMAVLPDGSGVVFDVTKQFSAIPALTPEPAEEGIFFVRADGKGLQRLGPASRVPTASGSSLWGVSPDGRRIAFIDLGRARARYEAPQVFLLDPRSGQRLQCTHQGRVAMLSIGDPGIWLQTFLDNRTIGFYAGPSDTIRAFQVKAEPVRARLANVRCSPEKESPPITVASGAHIVSQFAVTAAHPHAVVGNFPGRPAEDLPGEHAREVFLIDGKDILQLTAFNRSDTSPGGDAAAGLIIGDRVLFLASTNRLGENQHEICQLFSIGTLGQDLRQLTHLPWDGRPSPLGCVYAFPGCGIAQSTAADQVTGTVLFSASCDPVGANPFGEQIFAMRPDGTGLRQLTNARGMTTDPDGTVHVEIPGPFAYSSRAGG